ncbi:unnamed protein product [[Candida] boidinii]|nr:unnamed protein product [[Candida] boidinii]GMF99113.1 unnamed protein product [[Candida] boidinii]
MENLDSSILEPIDLISVPFKFQIKDGRLLSGVLIAIDDCSNLLVTDVEEEIIVLEPSADGSKKTEERHLRRLGLMSIPRDTITKILIKDSEFNKTIKYRLSKN